MKLPKVLFVIFVVVWVILAINPLHRLYWFLENLLIFLFAPIVVWSYFKFRLSNASYVLLFIFGILHVAAAHYTYGDTPWGDWLSGILGFQRNHFDRIVHFLYGALMTPVVADIFKKYLPAQGFARAFLIFAVILSIGSLYEIAEFVSGAVLQPDRGLEFVGFQGDIWDTQKDMILQGLGAVLGLTLMRKML